MLDSLKIDMTLNENYWKEVTILEGGGMMIKSMLELIVLDCRLVSLKRW